MMQERELSQKKEWETTDNVQATSKLALPKFATWEDKVDDKLCAQIVALGAEGKTQLEIGLELGMSTNASQFRRRFPQLDKAFEEARQKRMLYRQENLSKEKELDADARDDSQDKSSPVMEAEPNGQDSQTLEYYVKEYMATHGMMHHMHIIPNRISQVVSRLEAAGLTLRNMEKLSEEHRSQYIRDAFNNKDITFGEKPVEPISCEVKNGRHIVSNVSDNSKLTMLDIYSREKFGF